MTLDKKFGVVLEKIEKRIEARSLTESADVIRDIRSKLFAYLFLMRGDEYEPRSLNKFTAPGELPPLTTKGRASTSIITTLLPSALNKKSIDEFIDTLSTIPYQKVVGLSKLMREHGVTFTSMYNMRGFPDEADIDGITNLIELCTIKNGEEEPVFLKKQFSSLCSMFTRQPFPREPSERAAFFSRVREFQNAIDECAVDYEYASEDLLASFTGMQTGKGMPEPLTKIKDFADEIAKLTGGTLNKDLLASFTGMLHGRGMPEKDNVEFRQLIEMCIPRGGVDALKYVLSGSSGMGLPSMAETERLLRVYERVKTNGVK
jgi:hypothetical protein